MAAVAQPQRTVLSTAIWQAAEAGDAAEVEALLAAEGYASPDCRSTNQSTLLHCAAKHGHAVLAEMLLRRGADVNALDYGGMRRTPLHWACKGGHVSIVELLIACGADTKNGRLQADGRSWSKLVQGSRCGSLIPRDAPTESVESVCRTNAVRLALTKPPWDPRSNHFMWPQRFKEAARLLLLASSAAPHGSSPPAAAVSAGTEAESAEEEGGAAAAPGGSGGSQGSGSPVSDGGLLLSPDALLEVLRHAAYPISSWI